MNQDLQELSVNLKLVLPTAMEMEFVLMASANVIKDGVVTIVVEG